MATKNDFMSYEEARLSGEYNMIMDAHQVMKDYGIDQNTYWDIIKNYDKYYGQWVGNRYTNS